MREEAKGKTGVPRPERDKVPRPRDELGRPQPWGAENRLTLEPYDELPLERNHELGITSFRDGRFFPAHEAWETAWKQARGTEDAEFFKGLSQLGAGYVHLLRGGSAGIRAAIGVSTPGSWRTRRNPLPTRSSAGRSSPGPRP